MNWFAWLMLLLIVLAVCTTLLLMLAMVLTHRQLSSKIARDLKEMEYAFRCFDHPQQPSDN